MAREPDQCLVLIVDDHPEVAAGLTELIEQMGHRAIALTDARDVVEMVRRHRPHIVLMDIQMPNLDGWQVAEEIRRRCADLDVALVAVTGLSAPSARKQSGRVGFDAHLVKPLDATVVERIVNHFGPCRDRAAATPL